MNEADYLHVMPLNDLREHLSNMRCWCHPTQDEETSGLWVHHSMDQREKYETGELRPQ